MDNADHDPTREFYRRVAEGTGHLPVALSSQIRTHTAPLHRETETLLGLPAVIKTQTDYCTWLGRFFGLYSPLERLLATFPDWDRMGMALPPRSHGSCLADDLAVLGIDPLSLLCAPDAMLPSLPTFAHALGAFYVLEGSTLGGRIILRDVEARIGASLAGATRFFDGRGEALVPMWQHFRTGLDRFGREHPQRQMNVLVGAERTFRAIMIWFAWVRDAERIPA